MQDLSSFATNSTHHALRMLGDQPLWCDVSMSRIWYSFIMSVVVLIICLPIPIVFILVSLSSFSLLFHFELQGGLFCCRMAH